MTIDIIGTGHTKFGRFADTTLADLIGNAANEALVSSNVAPADIGGIWISNFNAGMVEDAFASSLVLEADHALRYVPSVRVENACASGSAAIFAAIDAVESGRIRHALVVGVEKMTHLDGAAVTKALGRASYQGVDEFQPTGEPLDFTQVFAEYAKNYFGAHGDQSLALAKIAHKNHQNAMLNPLAHLQKEIDLEVCANAGEKNPMIAEPLRRTDCSLVSDGAAAVVISKSEIVPKGQASVTIRATGAASDFLPLTRQRMTSFAGPKYAISRALDRAQLSISDIDFAEVHDCFTIAELLIYEAMGLAKTGQGANLLEEGAVHRGGKLPVNLSGGLKAKGHPIGASGVSMHALVARQLMGLAGDMQLHNAKRGLVFNMGGTGVANYCSILEARQL